MVLLNPCAYARLRLAGFGFHGNGSIARLLKAASIRREVLAAIEGGFVPDAEVRERLARALGTTPGVLWQEHEVWFTDDEATEQGGAR